MPFEEANAQTALMNELTVIGDRIRGLLSTNQLLLDSRYGVSADHLQEALSRLVDAESAVGHVPRLSD